MLAPIRSLILFLALALLATAPFAQEVAGALKCSCREHYATYTALRCPKKAPADPTRCEVANKGLTCKTWKAPSKDGYGAGNMESFLLRHAAAWHVECSLCAKALISKKAAPRPEHAEMIAVAAKMKRVGGKRIEAARSHNYLFVTDLPPLKITTAGGGFRMASRHELLHLYLQRAEIARLQWVDVFGEPRHHRSAIVLSKSDSVRSRFASILIGNPQGNLLFGGGSKGKLDDATNGFCLAARSDDDLHFNTRHMIGHLCISTYHNGSPFPKHLPQWIFRGSAHWLCKIHPRARDHAFFCAQEGVTVSGSGARWSGKARKIAARGPDRDPVERMFQAATAKQMSFNMHVRSWSWFNVFIDGEREPFVRFVQSLRDAQEARVAAKAAWGQAPEYVDDRWREAVLGKRRNVEATDKEKSKESEIDEASGRELRGIAKETDLQLLASKIRGLERCQNIKTARLIVSLLDSRSSDRVQEVAYLVLGRTTDEEVMAYLRGKGYARAGKYGKATLCRVFGANKDAAAKELLRNAMSESFWLVKANAIRALSQLGDVDSIPAIAEVAGARGNGKVRIAAMNALGRFGRVAENTIPKFERNLMDSKWQVKVATCDTFRSIGSTKALDMLIGRMSSEGGRVRDEINRSVYQLAGMERDWTQDQWAKWWNHMKKFRDLEKRMKDVLDAEKKRREKEMPAKDGRRTVAGPRKTKPPTYYGIKVYARAVGYVIDYSLSMNQGFSVSKEWQQRLGRVYNGRTRMEVVKEEIAQALKELDPRTRVNMVFFNDRVRVWKNAPVPAGSAADSAAGAVRALNPSGQTNYYDALRAVLAYENEGASWRASFADTPDTLFFLTDGSPTDGEITKADELLGWWHERNRFARLKVHVIAMGNTGVDITFLRTFANKNGGKFVHMTGSH